MSLFLSLFTGCSGVADLYGVYYNSVTFFYSIAPLGDTAIKGHSAIFYQLVCLPTRADTIAADILVEADGHRGRVSYVRNY